MPIFFCRLSQFNKSYPEIQKLSLNMKLLWRTLQENSEVLIAVGRKLAYLGGSAKEVDHDPQDDGRRTGSRKVP